jgi:hypothetical protein
LRCSRFANTGESSLQRVFLGTPEHGGRDLARFLEETVEARSRDVNAAAGGDRERMGSGAATVTWIGRVLPAHT